MDVEASHKALVNLRTVDLWSQGAVQKYKYPSKLCVYLVETQTWFMFGKYKYMNRHK